MTYARPSNLRLLPFTLALLATSACGGSVENSGNTPSDAGGGGESATDDGATPGSDAAPDAGGQPEASAGLVTVALSSCIPTVYTVGATVGGSQQFQLLFDTGSTSLGVAATGCSCGSASPLYTPGTTAVNEHTTTSSQFGSGSWAGAVYQDSVALGTSASTPVKLVAISTQQQFFEPIQCDSKSGGTQGVIGFGPGASAVQGTNGFFDDFVATTKLPDVFATQLCETTGTLWLGGYDPAATTAAPQYTPFSSDVASQYYYSVSLSAITVNGTTVPVPSGQYADSVVDTGTSELLLGTTAFNAISTAIAGDAGFTKLIPGGAAFFPTVNPAATDGHPSVDSGGLSCATLSQTKAELDATLPPLTLTFGSVSIQAVATESYLFTVGGGQWCPAMVGIDNDPQQFPLASILGAPLLRSNVVIFDRAQKRIGFAPHAPCP